MVGLSGSCWNVVCKLIYWMSGTGGNLFLLVLFKKNNLCYDVSVDIISIDILWKERAICWHLMIRRK